MAEQYTLREGERLFQTLHEWFYHTNSDSFRAQSVEPLSLVRQSLLSRRYSTKSILGESNNDGSTTIRCLQHQKYVASWREDDAITRGKLYLETNCFPSCWMNAVWLSSVELEHLGWNDNLADHRACCSTPIWILQGCFHDSLQYPWLHIFPPRSCQIRGYRYKHERVLSSNTSLDNGAACHFADSSIECEALEKFVRRNEDRRCEIGAPR